MAGHSRVKPPQSSPDYRDDLSSLNSYPSIQNSPNWPSVKLLSPGPSVRTLNQSNGGTYHDDISSLANCSSKDIDPSDRGSVFTANMSAFPSSSRQPALPPLVLSSRESIIGSAVFQDDSSYRSASLLTDNVSEGPPREFRLPDKVLVPPLQSTPNGDVEGRSKHSSEGHQSVSTNDTAMLCYSCGLLIEGAFVGALGTTSKFHLQCFRSIDGHEDHESIPQVIEVTKLLPRETQPGVASAEQKVELWRYNANLVFKPGEAVDMDLLAENRSLIYVGKLLRRPDNGFDWSRWNELFVLLFDNYLVMTKPKERDGITKYDVKHRPIPLDLLRFANFTDPTQRRTGLLRGFGGNKGGDVQANTPDLTLDAATDSRVVFPCTILHIGRLGGLHTVDAESSQARTEWKEKLEEAIGLRKVVQESNRVFEVVTLSLDTLVVPPMFSPPKNQSWNLESPFMGKVTCSVPFTTADGRARVAVGCAEGVWIGFRHDPRSMHMRRVLHLKMVTQCAMLEDFGIFLVLADKSLFAYDIEALVPTSPQSANPTQIPQKLNGPKGVHFFSVGSVGGRTLVIYMTKKGFDSVFRVLEPIVGKINDNTKVPVLLSSRIGRQSGSEWFRIYRDFFLLSEVYDLIFLRASIAILCKKGFEVMDLSDFESVTIPRRDDPRHEKLIKRCDSSRPMGMLRSSGNDYLLCYKEFGLYVNRRGDPRLTKGTIEWEGTAEHVAWRPPYVLIFDSRFIEVRHIETGRLCQIIPGNDLRCIWDGRGGLASQITPGPNGTWEEAPSQDARVHGVMCADDSAQGNVVQHVFQLIPTVSLPE